MREPVTGDLTVLTRYWGGDENGLVKGDIAIVIDVWDYFDPADGSLLSRVFDLLTHRGLISFYENYFTVPVRLVEDTWDA